MSDIEQVEEAIDRLIGIDRSMCGNELILQGYVDQLDTGDEWDRMEVQRHIDAYRHELGQASTWFVMEMNAVIYHGQKLIDEWRDTDLMMIGRKYSVDAPFYKRAQDEWPEVTKNPVWVMLRSSGVPF